MIPTRNIGILCAFWCFFSTIYIVAAEFAKPPKSKGEVLVFPSGKMPNQLGKKGAKDIELQPPLRDVSAEKQQDSSSNVHVGLATDTAVFHWEDLCYDIQVKKENHRILDYVDGWVKPGTATALMV